MPIYSNFYQTLTTACPIVELRGYAAACGVFADVMGFVAAVWVAYLFFG